jgi:dienelactone hydrolase
VLLPVLLSVAVCGCESGTSSGPAAMAFTPGPAPSGAGFVALYAPPVDVGPYPSDIYNPLAAGTGPTLAVPEKLTSPLGAALNTLDGFSTTAAISAPFNAALDPDTLIPFDAGAPNGSETVFVLDASAMMPLTPGIDYALGISGAAGTNGAVLEIVPIVPLEPRTTYAFILTTGIENDLGVAAAGDQIFAAVRDAHLAGLSSVPGAPELDALFPAITPLIDLATAELGIPGDAVVNAWSMTTQSIVDVLAGLEATAGAQTAQLAPTGLTTAAVDAALPGLADIYIGYIEIPYFGDPQDPLGSVWVTASLAPPTAADPVPIARVPALRIPVLATLPNADTGQSMPAGGWPVVIYQHGVTDNRTSLFAIADAFAAQGFAAVAIDLPLHGITDTANPFYQGPENAANPFGDNERHFYLDMIDAVGRPIADGKIDDGRQIFNIANPLNARDHIRQAASDLIHLIRTVPALDFDGGGPDLDGDAIHHVGVSLGSAFSSVVLGLNSDIGSATMSSPFATWTAILTDPQAVTFGAAIRAGLAAEGLAQGSVYFDGFVRDLQTVLDSADPANYAAAAATLHPLHVLEVLGDVTVPNGPTDYLAGLWDATDVTAASPVLMDVAGVRGIVRFTSGDHTSLLSPAADPAVTAEMQTQMVTFAVTGGTTIAVSDESVVQ